jgi:hypothetical protein
MNTKTPGRLVAALSILLAFAASSFSESTQLTKTIKSLFGLEVRLVETTSSLIAGTLIVPRDFKDFEGATLNAVTSRHRKIGNIKLPREDRARGEISCHFEIDEDLIKNSFIRIKFKLEGKDASMIVPLGAFPSAPLAGQGAAANP